MTTSAFIYDAIRTPRGKGKKDGSLHEVKPVDLLAGLLRALRDRNNLDTAIVEDMVFGCTAPVDEQGCNIGKIAAMVADYEESVASFQIDRACASGADAVGIPAMKIMSGMEKLVIAGGLECMSRVKMGSTGTPWADDPSTSFKTGFIPQGIGADLLATLDKISREDVDQYAVRSHELAAKAQKSGHFDNSVIPVYDENGMLILDKDETIRTDTNMEKMAKLKPSFEMIGKMGYDSVAISRYPQVDRINHVHHAGNSSGIVDGASALLIGSEEIGNELGLTPRARIIASSVVCTNSTIMVGGPIPATNKVLKISGMTLDQIDLFEVNEAFAAVPIHYYRNTKVPLEKINVNGGAIALGHPLGATGGILIGMLLDELERQQLKYGLVTLCAAQGHGIATIIERV